MKKSIFTGLFCTLLFIACTKTSSINPKVDGVNDSTASAIDTTPYVPGPPTLQFVFNGVQVQITGGKDNSQRDSVTGNYYGCYTVLPANSTLCSIIAEETNYAVLLDIHIQNNFIIGAYTGAVLTPYFFINTITYGINSTTDAITVNVTRYSNGTMDGNFSGMVSDNTGSEKTITQGKFSNLNVN
jgi:hypothetical protein